MTQPTPPATVPAPTRGAIAAPASCTLFAYGILRERATVCSVLDREWTGKMFEAVLPDHTIVRDMGPAYAFESTGDTADGFLLTDLTAADFERFDVLEGVSHRHYDRVPCKVITKQGTVETEFYRAGPRVQERYAERQQSGIDPWARWGQRTFTDDTDGIPPDELAAYDETDAGDYDTWLHKQINGSPATTLTANDVVDLQTLAKWEQQTKSIAVTVSAPATPAPRYPGTPDHLPSRRGIPLADAKRTGPPRGATLRLFVYDGLRSLDRLELVIDREWFGTRKAARFSGMRLTQSFPAFLIPDDAENASVSGHLLSGLTAADLEAIDVYMNVAAGFQRRVEVTFGTKPAFVYVMGDKGPELLKKARERRKLVKKARKAAAKHPAKPGAVPSTTGTQMRSVSIPRLPAGTGLAATSYPRWYTGKGGGKALTSWKPSH